MTSRKLDAIRWNHGYDARLEDGTEIRLNTRSAENVFARTLGGERLTDTAKRYPFTWCVVHPSFPAYV